MAHREVGKLVLFGIWAFWAGIGLTNADGADGPPDEVPPAVRAVEPAAPDLPAEVVAALQEKRFGEAAKALADLGGFDEADRPFVALVRGSAQRRDGKADVARETLRKALAMAPRGRWAAKVRSELAALELASGHPDEAERLARVEAEALLADARKDRLAGIYEAFANRLLEPDDPTRSADPAGAHELLSKARDLAKGDASRARLLLAMGRASQKQSNPGQAIGEFRTYLDEYPDGGDRADVRFHLAESLFAGGQAAVARTTWADLARDLQNQDDRGAADLRARSLYQIARTHGIPNPPDDTQLNLGSAALRRFLDAYPSHRLAPTAAFQLGGAFQVRGRSQQAIDAYTASLRLPEGRPADAGADSDRREADRLRMEATFRIAQVLQGQGRFDEAIDAFKGYLARYPDGPRSAEAQRSIIDTDWLAAEEHRRLERFDEARASYAAFVARHPLDARVPAALAAIGHCLLDQDKPDAAVAAWETLIGKFPDSEPAAEARYRIGLVLEVEVGDPAGAIERLKQVTVEPWASRARQRIAAMESKELTVITPRPFRSGETPHLEVTTRNLERLTFSAYKLDPEAYFRKKQGLEGVEGLDISLVAPDAEWTLDVPDYAKYTPIERHYDVKIGVPGVWVVKVTDESTLEATTLVLGTDLEAIVKASAGQVLVFAQDMKAGRGRPGARVLVSDGDQVILESKTGDDGVLLADWPEVREPGSALEYLILDGLDVAGSALGVPGTVARGLSARAYLDTDRPAYRPGQTVQLRGVVREVEEGRYANRPGAAYKLEVTDARGRLFVRREVKLSDFGTFHEAVALDPGAPVGTYRIRLHRPSGSDFAGSFEVQSYQLKKVDLAFDLPRTVFFRGETIEADLVARYQYGTPLAGRPIAVRLPDGRTLNGTTDAEGRYHLRFETEGYAEEQALPLFAQLPEEGVAAAATVKLAIRAFGIDLSTSRDVYLDGETFALEAETLGARGEPTGQALEVSVLKRVERAGEIAERPVATARLTTDPKTGKGSTSIRVEDAEGGRFVLRAAGTDRFGNPIVADRVLTISGKEDATKLRLLADRTSYKVGETAKVDLHGRSKPGTALLAWEADRILAYKIVPIGEGANPITWEVNGDQFPNFTLTAARMAGAEFHEARLDLKATRDLHISIRPTKPSVKPGEEVEVEVEATDQLGRPVAAEVSLAMVDRALLRLFDDADRPIGPFFHDQERTGAFATESTNTFRYAPESVPVAEAVVEEEERLEAELADKAAAVDVRGRASGMVAHAPLFAQQPAPASAPAIGGGGLGYGGMGGYGMAMKDEASANGLVDREQAMAMSRRKALESDDLQVPFLQGSSDVVADFGFRFGQEAAASTREQYVETAYWNPSVVTGADGRARVRFRAPSALSEYRFRARGVTGADTLVGQAEAGLAVRKDFFVDLQAPASLTEGDTPRFAARVHHAGLNGPIEVKLSIYAGGREQVEPRTLEIKGDGVEEVLFDPFEVPEGENVRLTLAARAGEAADELVVEVPVRPWGVQAFASASGTAEDDATVFVELPPGRSYESPEMLIAISPTLRRMLIELALGRDAYVLDHRTATCILPPPPDTIAGRAGDLLAATSALGYLQTTRAADAPEAGRLSDRVRGLVAELITLQNADGGWPWVAGLGTPSNRTKATTSSDRATSARAAWALATAGPLGLLPDNTARDKAAAYLRQEWAKVDAADFETRAAVLHALSTLDAATFEQANTLNRSRRDLPDAALAYLALTFANLDRASLGDEILNVLGPRSIAEPPAPGRRPWRHWQGPDRAARGLAVEPTALAALAFARIRPGAPELAEAVDWLLAQRRGTGWNPPQAKGPALAALAGYYGKARTAEDRYRLVVIVNETEVYRVDVVGQAEGTAVLVPTKALKPGGRNRVRFDIEGRGTFGYAATLTGFARDFKADQGRANRPFLVASRTYLAAGPTLDGKPLPTGFGASVAARHFENTVTQVARGGRARVRVDAARVQPTGQPAWDRAFLVLEEHLPAGTTLVEGSVVSQAGSFSLADGVLTLYFAPDQYPGVTYDVFGNLPGAYKALPTILRDAYDPGRVHLGPEAGFRVLAPGETSSDPYRPTPDELHARGKGLFDAGRLADAVEPLEALVGGYALRDDVARDVARMLLTIHIREYNPRKVVQHFEVLKQKAPDLVLPFDQIRAVGRAYRDIDEHERAFLVWRAIAEASYLEDAQVGEALRQRGRTLEGIAFLLGLWREYPGSASIQGDFFGLAQLLASLGGRATTDPALRRELARAEVAGPDLLLQSIRLIQTFLALAPDDPVADEASLALVGDYLELEDFDSVVRLSERFARLYPKSNFLDSFQFSEALGRFHLGQHDRAIAVAEAIAEATYKDAEGAEQPSPNRWQAISILGQIHDARRQPAEALAYYEQVADRFTDAAVAVNALTREALELPEVSVLRSDEGDDDEDDRPAVTLAYRNIAEADIKVYPVDLMRLYLARKNLDAIAGIDLAGITPLHRETIRLGDGRDFEDKDRDLPLPLVKEGAYLVMVRGDDRYASGIVLVSPLELEVLEEPDAGRVRVAVRDARTGDPVPKVQVRVIGSGNDRFVSGQTDLRGVFLAEGVRGQVTAVARQGTDRYALHRGERPADRDEAPNPPQPSEADADANAPAQALDQNLRIQNGFNQVRQIERLEQRYQQGGANGQGGVQVQGVR